MKIKYKFIINENQDFPGETFTLIDKKSGPKYIKNIYCDWSSNKRYFRFINEDGSKGQLSRPVNRWNRQKLLWMYNKHCMQNNNVITNIIAITALLIALYAALK